MKGGNRIEKINTLIITCWSNGAKRITVRCSDTEAVGNGPNYGGNETVNTSILHTYDEMVDTLKKQEAKQRTWNSK